MVLQTLGEWEAYIRGLAGQALRSKGINANTVMFTKSVTKNGLTTDDVAQIILLFTRQFVATGQMIPSGGLYDMPNMALGDPICMKGPQMDEAAVAELAANPPVEDDTDDWDEFELADMP